MCVHHETSVALVVQRDELARQLREAEAQRDDAQARLVRVVDNVREAEAEALERIAVERAAAERFDAEGEHAFADTCRSYAWGASTAVGIVMARVAVAAVAPLA